MAGRGNPFPRNYSTYNSSESSLFPNPIPEEKGKEHLYSVDNEVVDDLRRITRAYANKIGGLLIIPTLPRREYHKKDRPILEDAVFVEYFEELVEIALEEVVQPLNQLDPDTPYCSPIHSPPHSPLKIMANVNGNQPPTPPNPSLAWKARSALNPAPPLHDLPQDFEKKLPNFDPSENILVDDHLQRFLLGYRRTTGWRT